MADEVLNANRRFLLVACEDCGTLVEKTGPRRKLCLPCKKERKRKQDLAYRIPRRAELAAKTAKWALENRERSLAAKREYYWRDVEASRKRENERYEKEGERKRRNARLYYKKNREKVLARMSSPEGREYSRNRMREKLKDDAHRIHSNVSRAVRASIKDKRHRSWEVLVGYSLSDLMDHLERQFLPGMTWENHGRGKGKWHIDHIIPRASFSFKSADDPEFAQCWALTNLRPLWSEENISKHANRVLLL